MEPQRVSIKLDYQAMVLESAVKATQQLFDEPVAKVTAIAFRRSNEVIYSYATSIDSFLRHLKGEGYHYFDEIEQGDQTIFCMADKNNTVVDFITKVVTI